MKPLDPERWRALEPILDEALELAPAERAAFLASACAGEPALRREVEELLAADESADAFLAAPVGERAAPLVAELFENGTGLGAGDRVGPWRLVEKIGEGGMGEVFLAERVDGEFVQRAAVKLVRRGLASPAALARFRPERQILAALEHPGIARLLDGGVAADGRPYFALEYVDRRADHRRCDAPRRSASRRGSRCCSTSARRSSTRTATSSSTAISSRATSWSTPRPATSSSSTSGSPSCSSRRRRRPSAPRRRGPRSAP